MFCVLINMNWSGLICLTSFYVALFHHTTALSIILCLFRVSIKSFAYCNATLSHIIVLPTKITFVKFDWIYLFYYIF